MAKTWLTLSILRNAADSLRRDGFGEIKFCGDCLPIQYEPGGSGGCRQIECDIGIAGLGMAFRSLLCVAAWLRGKLALKTSIRHAAWGDADKLPPVRVNFYWL
jgi:hypothetical protein